MQSVRARFLVAVAANGVRSVLGFLAGLLVARSLSPAGYGDVMFLVASFAAIRGLFDLGSSSAFFTFISRRARGLGFYGLYGLWLIAQFLLTLLLVALLIPQSLFETIWLGNARGIVVLALLASFMQQQVLQTLAQVGESQRKTLQVQSVTVLAAMVYLGLLLLQAAGGTMSPQGILWALVVQGIVVLPAFYWLLRGVAPAPADTLRGMLAEYAAYCRPLLLLAFITFLYDFSDKWLLQRFGGAAEQGYFQIANQFSSALLMATLSLVNIFWKEIAAAWERGDQARIASLYARANRGLVMLSTVVVGLAFPWSEQLVQVLLGDAYAANWPVLAIMLLYPIHLPMGVIGGSTLLASGQTRLHMLICTVGMLVSIPVSYFVLAPSAGAWGGLGLGALGLALKLVVLNVLTVNIQAWLIARQHGWRLDWSFQLLGIPAVLALGWCAKRLALWLWPAASVDVAGLIAPAVIAAVVYAGLVAGLLRLYPSLLGGFRWGGWGGR